MARLAQRKGSPTRGSSDNGVDVETNMPVSTAVTDDSFVSVWHTGPNHHPSSAFTHGNWMAPATPPPTSKTTPNMWTPKELTYTTSTPFNANATPSVLSPASTTAYEQVRDELGQIKELAKSLERRLDAVTKLRPSHGDGGFSLESGTNDAALDSAFEFGAGHPFGMTGADALDAGGTWSQCNDEMEFRHRLTALQERLGAAIADVGLLMLEQDSYE